MSKSLEITNINSPILLVLKWAGYIDIDLSSLLLSNKGKIFQKADVIFYNSNNRTVPFNKQKFRNKSHWKNCSSPVSLDGSVEILQEEVLYDDNKFSEYDKEGLLINLSKTKQYINRIIFVASIFNYSSNHNFNRLTECIVEIIDKPSMRLLDSYNLLPIMRKHIDSSAIVFAELSRQENDIWYLSFLEESYNGGLFSTINQYS